MKTPVREPSEPSGSAVDINLAAVITANARDIPDSVAIRYEGTELTYAQLVRRSHCLAAELADNGVGIDDRVAYAGFNSPAFLITLLASFHLGAIFVPVNYRMAGPEISRVLAESDAIAIICEEGHREVVDGLRDNTRLRCCLVVDDDPAVPAAPSTPGWQRLSAVTAASPPELRRRGLDDPAILMFTSGTSGSPKGVTLSHGNIWWNSRNVDLRLDTRRGDVTYAAAPLFHVGGLNSFVLQTLARAGTVVLRRSFDPETFLQDVAELQVNSMFAVPSMLAAVARIPGAFDVDMSSLRAIVVASAPVPSSLILHFAEHGIWLQQAWGLTETAPFATHLPAERTLDKVGSAGVAMPYTEVRVVDRHTNQPVAAGVRGEIVVRGPNVSTGYWNKPDVTQEAFDSEGFFHSGDIGYLDEDGYLYVVDRLTDMVITGGENVYPAEVERALADLPGVVDIAVVGAPHPHWGETVVAVASVDAGRSLTLDRIRDHAALSLARYKLPTRVVEVESVPRNAAGKLDKAAVHALLVRRLTAEPGSEQAG